MDIYMIFFAFLSFKAHVQKVNLISDISLLYNCTIIVIVFIIIMHYIFYGTLFVLPL